MAQANPFGAKLNVRLVKVATLTPWDRNPRTITPKRLADLQRDLAADPEMLWVRPLVARPDGTVLMGNQRLAAAVALGWSQIPVAVVDADDEVGVLRALRDNVPYGEWTDELGAILLELPAPRRDLAGFDSAALQKALALAKYAPLDRDEDLPPAAPGDPVTKPGDVIDLGPHRLVCGDATDPEVWQALLAGTKQAPALSVTDPPYGVAFDASTTPGAARRGGSRPNLPVMAGDSGGLETTAIWERWLSIAAERMAPAATIYTFGPLSQLEALVQVGQAILASPWRVGAPLVWDRGYMGLGRFTWRHRCELAWELHRGDGADWVRGEGIDNLLTGHQSGPYAAARDPEAYEHPTPKPTTLMQSLIQTRAGEVVVDPFAGSGSVLIACEQLERRALLIEIDPAFCDLIRRRWDGLRGGA